MVDLDTREKRASSIAISLYSMAPSVQAGASGIDLEDRQMIGYGYMGISAGGAPAVTVAIRLHNIDAGFTSYAQSGMGGVLQ